MGRFIRILAVAIFILAASAAPVLAKSGGGHHCHHGLGHGHGVPEIDPSLAPGAIALLAGGLLILRSKSARK